MSQPAQNRREYFRLQFIELVGTMQVIQVGERFLSAEAKPIDLRNVGGGGLYFQSSEDLAIRRGITAVFRFTLGGQTFHFHGELTRKVDDRRSFYYGVAFVDVDERVRAQLLAILSRMQIERNGRAGA
jgi:hypothetical protein